MKITILVENHSSANTNLETEHGLSMLVEVGNQRILFDTGQSAVLCRNAARLNVDLSDVDAVVLSHGHYDHTGGIPCLYRQAGCTAPVFVHSSAFQSRYSNNPDRGLHFVGMAPETKAVLEQRGMVSTDAPCEVIGGFMLTGTIPRMNDFEDCGGNFYLDRKCNSVDELPDDQAGYVDTPNGLVVILGCAHAGVINTLEYIRQLVPHRPIYAVIGGMHLKHASASRIETTIKMLRERNIKHIFPLHCSGDEATTRLAQALGHQVKSGYVGLVLEF